MLHRNIEPTPWAQCRFEQEAQEVERAVDCTACGGTCLDGAASVLQGLVYCEDCVMAEALRLRSDESEWRELSRADQVEALDALETGARLERMQLARKAG